MMNLAIHRVLAIYLLLLISFCKSESDETLADLYRKTVNSCKSQRSWDPWISYTQELSDKFRKKDLNRLDIIGGFEEGILVIEKSTVARGAGEDLARDAVVSQLYVAYGSSLLELDSVECHELALDPHTLLIGAKTVSRNDKPSTHLCIENAENSLRNAATLDATNKKAEDLLEKITGMESVHKRKPKEFVAELFDSFADTFDDQLLGTLGYKVPQLVGVAAKGLGSSYRAVLDAGCGTGLAGRFLKPLVKDVMIGIDASQKMLNIAAKCTTTKGCGLTESEEHMNSGDTGEALYDDLLAMDLEDMTLDNTLHRISNKDISGFSLIVAADVLVYFGSIIELLKTFAKISASGAALIFSCERTTPEEAPLGWRLLPSGRFAHTKQHAEEAALEAGYELVTYEEIVPRMEKGEEVRGHLFGFTLTNDLDRFEL